MRVRHVLEVYSLTDLDYARVIYFILYSGRRLAHRSLTNGKRRHHVNKDNDGLSNGDGHPCVQQLVPTSFLRLLRGNVKQAGFGKHGELDGKVGVLIFLVNISHGILQHLELDVGTARVNIVV